MSMIISLPDSLTDFVQKQVADGDYTSADAYVGALVEADCKRSARLEDLVVAGLESGPATPLTEQDWERVREYGLRRIQGDQRG